jgi:hypothetical protein
MKKQAQCFVCGQTVKVRKNGYMVEHYADERRVYCAGGGMKPR